MLNLVLFTQNNNAISQNLKGLLHICKHILSCYLMPVTLGTHNVKKMRLTRNVRIFKTTTFVNNHINTHRNNAFSETH